MWDFGESIKLCKMQNCKNEKSDSSINLPQYKYSSASPDQECTWSQGRMTDSWWKVQKETSSGNDQMTLLFPPSRGEHQQSTSKESQMFRRRWLLCSEQSIYNTYSSNLSTRAGSHPWLQALEVCFQSCRFSCSREGGLLAVSPTVINLCYECTIVLD